MSWGGRGGDLWGEAEARRKRVGRRVRRGSFILVVVVVVVDGERVWVVWVLDREGA